MKQAKFYRYAAIEYGRHLLFLLFLFFVLAMLNAAKAADSVCAEVKIVIEQEASFERQAFDARMIIRNGLTESELSSVNVELLFMDKNGNTVTATQDPNADEALFFYRVESLSGIDDVDDGCVGSSTAAEMHWLIIPTAGAGGEDGELYYVGARVAYTLNGQANEVEVTPDFIVVKPQPMLTLDYFLPSEVYADDAFTPEVEVPVPFTLGVRVSNTGAGTAQKMKIESAQPKIVENKQGLLIDFEILGGYVSDEPAGKSLLLGFGDIAPRSSKIGRWIMQTSLSGRFTEFNASFSHADALGGALTSLLEDVKTHMLVHDVKVNLSGRDQVRDFLVRDNDVLRVYESDGIDTDVADVSARAQLNVTGTQGKISIPQQAGFVYAKVNDPHQGAKPPVNVQRSDGKMLPVENIWLSKTRNEDLSWSYFINLFDVDSAGVYTLSFADDPRASVSGTVFEDTNGDGLLNASESGIPVVAVLLSGESEEGITVHVTAYTDATGKFMFSDLKPGRYALEVATVSNMVDSSTSAGQAGGVASVGKIADIVLGAGTDAKGNFFAKRSATAEVVEGKADLLIAGMSGSATMLTVGDEMDVLVMFGNAGEEATSNVVVELEVPDGFSLVSYDASVGAYDTEAGQWLIGDVQLYEVGLLRLKLKADALNTSASVTARIGGAKADSDLSNNAATITLSIQ